jgi:hypothetical protein
MRIRDPEGKTSDTGSGMGKLRIQVPGWEKFVSGMETLITGTTSAMVRLIITISDVNNIENNPIVI